MTSAEELNRAGAFAPGTRLGAYSLGEPLAAGGMGRVIAATHVVTGERVAIKTLLTRGPVTLEYFRREIDTLRALRHPAIVPLHDHGVLDGHPWYAMALLEGVTLRDALERTPGSAASNAERDSWEPTSGIGQRAIPNADRPDTRTDEPLDSERYTPERLLRVCRGVLGALEYLHARGVVHGDIKPENIFLRAGAQPVLVDFGLASSFDCPREQLGLIPRSIGSVAYMAPELLRGGLADARADLYAVGCILYEVLTGTHPFLQSTIKATALAHLRAERVPPSRLRTGIPRQLDMLVLRLIAKAPEDRPGYAGDALHVISASHVDSDSNADVDTHEESPRSGYLYRGPLVGRDALLAQIRKRLQDARAGRAGKIRLRGERGSGKTRVALELVEFALRDDCAVFHIACPSPAEAHEHPEQAPLRTLLRILGDHLEDALDERRVRVEELGATLRRLSQQDGKSRDDTAGLATSLVQDLCAEMLDRASRGTVLLLIDDAQYADALTREFLVRLAGELTDQRLLLFCTDGSGDGGDQTGEHFRHFEDLSLTGLDEASTALAIRSLLAIEHPSPALVSNTHRVSQGNPFIIGHYLRALIDGGVLRRDRHRGWHLHGSVDDTRDGERARPLRIESVATLFEWRLRDLTAEELELAAIASLLDTAFDERTLAAVARRSESEVEAVLLALSRKEVLKPEGRRSYGFTHPILGEILRAEARRADTRRVHRRAAAVLKQRFAELAPAPSALALHLRACGSHKKAAHWFVTAANRYLETHRRDEALVALEAAAAELSSLRSAAARREELLAIKETIGDVAMQVRRYPKAQQSYADALQLVGAEPLHAARVYRKLAGAHQRDRAVAMDCLQKAMAALASAADQSAEHYTEWIQVHLDTMWVHYWRQETASMLELAERIAPLVHARGSPRQQASLHFNLAVGLMQRYRYVTGATELSHVEQALSIYESLGDRTNVAMCRFVRAMIQLFGDDLSAAESGFEAVLALSERATSVTIRIRALTFLCILHRKRRDLERVRKLAAATHSLATEHDMPEYRGTAMANLSWVACYDGEFAECERLVWSAVSAWSDSPLNVFRWTGLMPLMAVIHFRPERQSDAAELAALARDMLHPSQQALPPELTDELTKLEAAAGAPNALARRIAKRVLDLAADANLI